MTDALALALWRVLFREIPDEEIMDWERDLDSAQEWYETPREFATAILADPAFREALTAALAEAIDKTSEYMSSGHGRPPRLEHQMWREGARSHVAAIVAAMLS